LRTGARGMQDVPRVDSALKMYNSRRRGCGPAGWAAAPVPKCHLRTLFRGELSQQFLFEKFDEVGLGANVHSADDSLTVDDQDVRE
jgi:hypothetical protein